MQNKTPLKLNNTRRFQCGNTFFTCSAGKTVYLLQRDDKTNKVLLDFGGGLIDWFHESVLSNFEPVTEN